MDRREFLAKAGLAATWAGISIRISACSDDGGGGGVMNPSGDVTGSVDGSHSHTGATVTEAQLAAGSAVTLTLSGSGHNHELRLEAPQVMDIADGTTVSEDTLPDTTGHVHGVTFN